MSSSTPQEKIHILSHVPEQGEMGAIFDLALEAEEALQLLDMQREFMRTRRVLQSPKIGQETSFRVQIGHFWELPSTAPSDPAQKEHQALLSSWIQDMSSKPEGRRFSPAKPELLHSLAPMKDSGAGETVQAEKITITNAPSFFFNYADPYRGYMPPALLIHRSELLCLSTYVLSDEEIEHLLPELAATNPDQLLEWLNEGFSLLGQSEEKQRPLPKIRSETRAKLLKHADRAGRKKLIRAITRLEDHRPGDRLR